LNILAALNNADKHRSIQPVHFLPSLMGYEIKEARDCVVTRTPTRARRYILEVGAELARFPVRRTGPNPYLDVKYELATFPAINERISFENWLDQIMRVIGGLLLRFAPSPKDELAKLGLPEVVMAS
jgi:hypothetical protein